MENESSNDQNVSFTNSVSGLNSRSKILNQNQSFERTLTVIEEDLKSNQKYDKIHKLGTLQGVFVPTTLNVLSILMFVRFSFIIGQSGVSGTVALLIVSLTINLLTALSISAISTNGTVRGGGAYYMISRSLGPEFGGSIGLVFYAGQVLNSGLNVVAFFDVLMNMYGSENGMKTPWIPESDLWIYLYSTVMVLFCTFVGATGSKLFSKLGNVLFMILSLSILSIPISLAIKPAYLDSRHEASYTGFSMDTLMHNFWPKFSKGAAGSSDSTVQENFSSMFKIFFPATAGIFAGAGMSGDLNKPSKSIPIGTLGSLLATFILYLTIIVSVGSSVQRELIYKDIQILQNISISGHLILIGELSTCLYSALVGIIGSAKLLQAIARDHLIPYLSIFGQGGSDDDSPHAALILTFIFAQLTILMNMNEIAIYITIAFLMTFVATNLACFLLKVGSAPNFRPSFRFFSEWTAGAGAGACLLVMFISDGLSTFSMLVLMGILFLIIHYTSPPKPWGDVSQTIIYHQVRKYLLRLTSDHVKHWRPQILLLVDDPKKSWNLLHFFNHLKKGGLYMLGHVHVIKDFHESFPEVEKQQRAWMELRSITNIKGFVQVAASTDVVWGARNVYLGSGLGTMRPNITVIGFIGDNHQPSNSDNFNVDIDDLPTDNCRTEPNINGQQWVNIIEDLITMHATCAVAKGFSNLRFPDNNDESFVDLYPIQMSPQKSNNDETNTNSSVYTTNFDTYTLILQLGAILQTVKTWKRAKLRVIAFVEKERQIDDEDERISELLSKLRIDARVKVICLPQLPFYNDITRGQDPSGQVSREMGDDEWWNDMRETSQQYNGRFPKQAVQKMGKDWGQVWDRRQQWFTAASRAASANGSIASVNTSGTGTNDTDTADDTEQTPLITSIENPNYTQEQTEGDRVPFNQVSAKGQHLILNHLMKRVSGDSKVIFTTLPAPNFGTHKSEEDSQVYIESLQTWTAGLPPIVLIHSQSTTVTTAL